MSSKTVTLSSTPTLIKSSSASHTNIRLILALICSIFVGEMLVILFFDLLPPTELWKEALFDSASLLILVFPSVYFFVVRPMNIHWAVRKTLEAAQQETLDRLQKIASQVPGVVFQFKLRPDGSSCAPYVNEALRDIYRLSPEEVHEDASKVFAVVHPDDRENHMASIYASARDLTPWQQEYRLKFNDETVRWLFGNALPQREADGTVIWYGFITDITEHKQRDLDLRIAAAAFESQEGMVITNAERIILRINHAFTRITGYSEEDAVGQGMRLLKSGRHDAAFYATMWESIQRTGTWQGEVWNRLKNGEVHPEFITITAVKDNQGQVVNYVGTYTDITARKAAEEEIKRLAFYDPLTQLPNRRMLDDRMPRMLARSKRAGNLTAVCLLDLDGFKQINDTLGHESGDQLLREVARRLRDCIRQEDTAARLGGDEFALVLGGFKQAREYEQTLARIIASVAAPYSIAGKMARVSASIGVSLFPADGNESDLLLRQADQSMYEAKQAGKNRYHLFDSSRGQRKLANQTALKKFSKALAEGQIVLHYQPIVDCRLGIIVGAEALVRWHHPVLGLLVPSEFIPVIADDDLIIELGDWMICNALQQMREWREAGINIKVSVNIFSRQLYQKDFAQRLRELLAPHSADIAEWLGLEIEIRETTALENINAVSETMREIRAMGVSVVLDDFGTGYSSLIHLKRLPVSTLKIDNSFVSQMLTDPAELSVVDGVINLAASFRFGVIAEGVESINHLLLLKDLGCNLMQGYAIAPPMPAERLSAWIKAFTPDPLWSLPKSQRPSRNYFELLLAETNHAYWIDQAVAGYNEAAQNKLRDPQRCRFGHWYHSHGLRHFQYLSEFSSLDMLHKNIHQTAARMSEQRRAGNATQARAEEAALLTLQNDFSSLLRRLRLMLSDELIGQRSNQTLEK